MAAVPVTISGVLFDKYGRTGEPVTIMGMASITGVGVGGGPIIPPEGGGAPPGIWGPTDPRPSNPIPIYPGGSPNPPNKPPEPIEPPVEWKAVWAGPEHGWVVVGIPTVPTPTPSS